MESGPDRRAFIGSAVVHLLAFLLVWWTETAQPTPPEFVAYDIELVSPPSPTEGEPAAAEELTVETPEESRPEPEPEPAAEEPAPPEPETEEPTPPEPAEEPSEEEPAPEEETPEEEPTPEEEAPPPAPAEETAEEAGAAEATPEAETSGEDIDVRMEGVRRDYPAYYNDIIRQINRCFRWRGSQDLTATVRFYIERDGTVSGLSVVEPSGNLEFDFEAMGAVECAGSGGRLDPLPEELPFDRLPIEFTFRPAGG